jgi:hypothetical protein
LVFVVLEKIKCRGVFSCLLNLCTATRAKKLNKPEPVGV